MNHLEALAKEWLAWMGHIGREEPLDSDPELESIERQRREEDRLRRLRRRSRR
jgi:hypothetical protein